MIEQPRLIRFLYKTPLVLAVLIGYLYGVVMIFNYREDSTNVTNAGFAIVASLAAISFSFARVLEDAHDRDRIVFAGERLLQGAILILVASILKYFVFLILKSSYFANSSAVETALSLTIGLFAALIFSNGILFAHTGLKVLNDFLLTRLTRYKDWDDIV